MTAKQRLFCAEYAKTLNATKSAINAGYSAKTAYSIGQELLKKPEIQNVLQEVTNEKIASKEAIQIFWSDVMNDNEAELKHRLRASELLCKSLGGFIEKSQVEIKETNTLADFMLEAYNLNKE